MVAGGGVLVGEPGIDRLQRYAAVRLVPIGARLDTVLAAHAIGLPPD